jgi:hypothetical protein
MKDILIALVNAVPILSSFGTTPSRFGTSRRPPFISRRRVSMVGVTILVLSASSFLVSWHQPAVPLRQPLAQGRVGIGPCAALDMKDPDVAKEYAAVMAFDTEKIVDELEASGIRPPPTMSAFGRWPNSGSDLARRRQPPITHRVRVLLLLRCR